MFKTLEEAIEAYKKLTEENEAVKAELAKVEADNKELNALITDLRASKVKGPSKPSFKTKEGEFEVTAESFNWNGKIVTAQDICNSKSLQAELIEGQCGFVVEK